MRVKKYYGIPTNFNSVAFCNISSFLAGTMSVFNRNHYFGFFLLSMLLWTFWSVVMLYFPEISTTHSYSRGIARIASLLIPSALYLYFNRDYLEEMKVLRAIIVGMQLSFGLFLFHVIFDAIPENATIPTAGAIWLNWIIGSPLAEELFFRGIVLRQELKSRPVWLSILISAVAFTLFHLPSWIIVQQQSISELALTSIPILVYGIVFGLIYWIFRSIWATFLPHAANNFVAQLINPL